MSIFYHSNMIENIVKRCEKYYFLCAYAGHIKLPEKMTKEITDFVLGCYAYTLAKIYFADLKYYKKYREKLVEKESKWRIIKVDATIEQLRSMMEVLKADLASYGKQSPVLDSIDVLQNIENRLPSANYSEIISQYKNEFHKKFFIDLDDLPDNYPIDKVKKSFPFLKVNVICEINSKSRTMGWSHTNQIVINIGRNVSPIPDINFYEETKNQITQNIRHEMLHFVQKMMNIGLGYSEKDNLGEIKEIKPSNIYREKSQASKAILTGKIHPNDFAGERASISKLLETLEIDPNTTVDRDLINKLKKEISPDDSLKSTALELLESLFLTNRELEDAKKTDKASIPYFLRDNEYQAYLADSKYNFINSMKARKEKINKKNFREFVGQPITDHTDQFFRNLHSFDRKRWENAVKLLFKDIAPLIEE